MIKKLISNLYKKHHTLNPYELADILDIVVHYLPLGNMRGVYYYDRRIKQIALNSNMDEWTERFVLAHELGHAIMHPNNNTPFLQSTFLSVDKLEIEANKFAAELLISDVDLMEHWEYTVDELAMLYGLPREIILLRLDSANMAKEVDGYLV